MFVPSNPAVVTPDTQKPTAPGLPVVSNVDAFGNATVTVPVSTDNIAVAGYIAFLDGSIKEAGRSDNNVVQLSDIKPGKHSIAIRAFDVAGNASGLSVSVNFIIKISRWNKINNTIPSRSPTLRLNPSDSLEGILQTKSKDGSRAWIREPTGGLASYDTDYNKTVLQNIALLKDHLGIVLGATGFIYMMYSAKNGTLFMVVRKGTLNWLYKSVDNGVSFGANAGSYNDSLPVTPIGWDGSTHLNNVTILGDRGFAEINQGGKTYYAFGEYNTNDSGNQDVSVVVSANAGDKWDRSISLDFGRHIHFVKQDPYKGYIWIGLGDSNLQSSLIRLDSILQTIQPGTTHEQLERMHGIKILHGDKRYVATDLHFEPDYILNPCDSGAASTEDQVGIWMFDYDLSYYSKVSDTFELGVTHSQYWITKHTRTNTLITCEILEGGATNPDVMYIRSSNDNGLNWEVTGTIMLDTSRTANTFSNMMEWNDQVWFCGSLVAGPYQLSSWAVTPSGVFDKSKHGIRTEVTISGDVMEYGAETIAPSAFVSDTHGTDAIGNGYSPRTPFKTLGYALTGSRCTYGHSVNILSELNEPSSIASIWSSAIQSALESDNYPLIIHGLGRSSAKVNISVTTYFIRLYDRIRTGHLILRDLNFHNANFGQLINQSSVSDTAPATIYDSHVENTVSQAVTGYKGNIRFVRSTIKNSNGSLIGSNSTGTGSKVELEHCFLDCGGTNGVLPSNTQGDIYIDRSTIANYSSSGVNLLAISDADRNPKITNTLIFSSAGVSVTENAGTVYNSDDFSNVVANRVTSIGTAGISIDAEMLTVGYRTDKAYGVATDNKLDIENKSGTDIGCYNL